MENLVGLGGLMSRVINRYAIIPVFNFLNNFIRQLRTDHPDPDHHDQTGPFPTDLPFLYFHGKNAGC